MLWSGANDSFDAARRKYRERLLVRQRLHAPEVHHVEIGARISVMEEPGELRRAGMFVERAARRHW